MGVLLTLANNASSSGASQPIPPEPDNIISSPPKKGKKESEVLDRMFAQNTPGDSGEWFWANGKPLLPSENTKAPKTLNFSEKVKKNNPQKKKAPKKISPQNFSVSVSRNLFRILQKSILFDTGD